MTRPLVLLKGLKSAEIKGVPEHLSRVLTETAQEKQEILEGYIRALRATNIEQIGEFYEALLPIWRDIQTIAAQHKDAWRGMVTAKYQGQAVVGESTFEALFAADLIDDLLSRISGDVDGLTKGEEKIIEEHDSDDTPSSIAIEHAARLCGAWRYQFTARTLFRRLREQRANGQADHKEDFTDTVQ
jgi:hypothetical protein